MLEIPNLAKDVVLRSKVDYQDQQKKLWDAERHLAIAYEKNRAQDDYMRFIDADLREDLPTPSNNITKRVNDRVSLVYMIPPVRQLGDEEYDMTQYNELTALKDLSLQGSERKTNLLGLIGTKITWLEGKFSYHKLIDFECFFDSKNPMKPVAVMFPIASADTVSDVSEQRWEYWDETEWRIYENGKLIDQGENQYGIIPIVWTYRELPDTSFLDADPDRELIMANRELNVLQLDGDANIRFRSFGQMYATGFMEETEMNRSQNSVLTLPEGSSIGTTSPEDTITSIKEWLKQIYTFVAQNHHLSVSFVEGVVAESAVAIKERNRELNDDRRSDVERWRIAEHDIYKIEKEIALVEANMKLPDEFSVDFSESITDELSPAEQQAKWDWDLEHNLTTLAQIAMERNPDKFDSIEDAQEFIDANKAADAPTPTLANALIAPVE